MAVSVSERAPASPRDDPERARQVRQAEELLFSGPATSGFAKALFRGEFRGDVLFPYPTLPAEERARVDAAVSEVRTFADVHIDAAAIDRQSDIPAGVVEGLSRLGVMGMTA